ncbi:unnamed protein product [marine sediment metagenome]|uniref:Uncharacterized protein n=1 Tax=marine sediment metagenome TaxID=412755 RepID=X1Q311_9ZZZZ
MSFINNNMENNRVRICFDCREFHRINVSDYKTKESLQRFEKKHRGHRTQVVDMKELAEIFPDMHQSPKIW